MSRLIPAGVLQNLYSSSGRCNGEASGALGQDLMLTMFGQSRRLFEGIYILCMVQDGFIQCPRNKPNVGRVGSGFIERLYFY
jgi:hypothetical protein